MKAKRASSAAIAAALSSTMTMTMTATISPIDCFAPTTTTTTIPRRTTTTSTTSTTSNTATTATSSTSLCAIGVFVRKAKEAEVRRYMDDGPSESVLALLRKIEDAREAGRRRDSSNDGGGSPSLSPSSPSTGGGVGVLQSHLTKRRGTISIIAEYKRNLPSSGYIVDVPPPAVLSSTFREFGASAVAVSADMRYGGCTYDDVASVVDEQNRAIGEVPGPLPVISSDVVVDPVQVARSKDAGAIAITISYGLLGGERARMLIEDAAALDMETIVVVETPEEAKDAVYGCGASMVCVSGTVVGAEAKRDVISDLMTTTTTTTDGDDGKKTKSICLIANVLARDNKALEEVEEAWACRDYGFHAVWVSDALYKSGNDPAEHPGAIIGSMRAKSSVKYASPKARSGKGEGAREYLGDILIGREGGGGEQSGGPRFESATAPPTGAGVDATHA
ncbi:hypothetical protein ACHAW5_004401 [Stephanodiscus triporus]|uniref:indole-3-glycerol-phosphate synthase n=1 Tax=Stephanodiscus triporus TaxID=2934178 RepID=A0ABD3QJ43_9STRA